MPSIYGYYDGWASHYGNTWDDTRKGTPANSAGSSSVNWAIRVTAGSGRGSFGLSDGSGAGTFLGQVPTYSSVISSWSTGWNSITLNDTALMAIGQAGSHRGTFRICLMNYTYDYLDVALPAGIGGLTSIKACGAKFSSSAGSGSDPYLAYEPGEQTIFMGANF